MKLKPLIKYLTGILCLFIILPVHAQNKILTLILKSGDEIKCKDLSIRGTEIYFEAISSRQAYRYGEILFIEKIKYIKTANGRFVKPEDYSSLANSQSSSKTESQIRIQKTTNQSTQNNKAFLSEGPGLKIKQINSKPSSATKSIGVQLPNSPPPPQLSSSIEYTQLADLLSESGLAGKLLYDVSVGELHNRHLTDNQKKLIDAIRTSRSWGYRKRDLREAHLLANEIFDKNYQRIYQKSFDRFKFQPTNRNIAFLEFIQFLHSENAHRYLNKWELVENNFNSTGAAAIKDILYNYNDWYYLYGQEIEKRK